MLLKLARYFLLGLVLLLIFMASALLSMRFAIHGQEVRVPQLAGLTTMEAERMANAQGLVFFVETRFYTPAVPKGRVAAQAPAANTRVRRGWRVVVAESMGPQRAVVHSFLGQSQHAADVNLHRRGLELDALATVHFPGAPPATVIAQSPPANAQVDASPRIALVFSAADNARHYVMPNFAGKPLGEAAAALEKAGFLLGKVYGPPPDDAESGDSSESRVIVRQRPKAGQKVAAGTAIDFVVGN